MLDHKYKVFYHLARNPNATKVAGELYLSQPAVSKNIRELEKELGITLFHRVKGRLNLTEAGQYLLTETEAILRKEREILTELDKMRNIFDGTLSLGASTTLSQYVLPGILAGFTAYNPAIRINLISGNTEQIEKEILSGDLHLAFIEGTPGQPDIRYIPYLKDELVLVCSAENPVADTIRKEELQQLCFVSREKGSGTYHIIRKHLEAAGIPLHTLSERLVLGTTEGIKQYLQCSDCFALLSVFSIRQEAAAGKLKIVDIEGLTIERTFYAIHRQGETDPYAQKFLDYAFKNSKQPISL